MTGTGQSRARLSAQGASWSPSSTHGTPYGRQRSAGTTGANRDTTGVPTAAARWAGAVFPVTTTDAPARTPDSSGASVRRRGRCRAGGHVRREVALVGAAGDQDAVPGGGQFAHRLRAALGAPGAGGDTGARVQDDVRAGAGQLADGGRCAHPQPSVVGPREARRLRQVQRRLGLVGVRGTLVAQVEQGTRVVHAVRGDVGDAREAQDQGGGERDWWKDVRTSAVSASIRSTRASMSARSTSGGRKPPHGASQTSTSSTPGSSRAAARRAIRTAG